MSRGLGDVYKRQILASDWGVFVDHVTDAPGPVSATATVEFPRVPLAVSPWFRAHPNSATIGKKIVLDIDGPKGRLWHMQVAGYFGARAPMFGFSTGLPGVDEWAFEYDHHALAQGTHTFTITADYFHGEVLHYFVTYLRPGETGAPPPTASGDGAVLSSMDALAKGIPAPRLR